MTAGGLRADMITAELTPRLHELEADWRGSAVTASSEPVVSFFSLATGSNPRQHGLLVSGWPSQRPPSLPEVLARAGYRIRLELPESYRALLGPADDGGPGDAGAAPLLTDGDFSWIHFSDAEFLRKRWRRGEHRDPFQPAELLKWADPERPLPPDRRQALLKEYAERVRSLDRKLGDLVDRLRQSPAWPRTTLVVTATHGLELGEHGQVLVGENLGRETIEVPLFVRLAEGSAPLAEPSGGRVAQTRIWTTLVEIAGLEPAPANPPSLFRSTEPTALSELYLRNGENHFSLLEGDLQLHWRTRFAPPEAEYYLARRVEAGARARRASEPARRIFGRLEEAFLRTLPLSGPPGSRPRLVLERWSAEGVEPVEDPAEAERLGIRLRQLWTRFVGDERFPENDRSRG